MVECRSKGIKYSLILTNLVIFLSGAIVLALGIWTVSDRSVVERLLGINRHVASAGDTVTAVPLIVTGAIVAFISMLGSLGAYKEIRTMLKTYFFILLALLAVILTVGITCFIFRNELDNWLQKEMHASMKLYGNDTRVTEAWDSIQTNFKCCGSSLNGVQGPDSWRRESARFNNTETGPLVPFSCCRSREDDQISRACQGKMPRKEDTFFDECFESMKDSIKSHIFIIGLTSTFALSIIVFGLILSVTLYFLIGRKSAEKLSDSSSGE